MFKRSLNLVILNTVFHQLNTALKNKLKVTTNRHQKKLMKKRKQQESKFNKSTTTYIKNIINNFSSYQLTTEKHNALSYGLDCHIPCK